MNKKFKYLIIIFLIVASFIAFGRIIGNDFINFDDNVYITENNHIKSGLSSETIKWAFGAVVSSNWHPLTLLSHALDWQLFGANASGHHLVSLLLHIGSAILLFLFLNKTTGALWPAAFVAALFALHPLRVESVAWTSERKDVLSMFLGMATIYVYALYVEDHKLSKYFLCLALFALSLMAKPMLVTLPFLLLLLDYWPLGRWPKAGEQQLLPVRNDGGLVKNKGKQRKDDSTKKKISVPPRNHAKIIRSLLWEKVPFVVLAMISSVLTIWAQYRVPLEQLPLIDRMLNAIVSYVQYLMKIFWPVNLAVFYPYDQSLQSWRVFGAASVLQSWQFFGPASILLGTSIAVIYAIKKAPYLFVGWFWYLGALVPVIGLMQVGRQSMADRYTYFPSIGIAIILAWGAFYLLPKEKTRKMILIPAAVIILAALTFLTWQQCGYWKNSISLFSHVLQATKDNYLAHNNLGTALAADGKYEEAIAHYREAIKINPTFTITHFNLGAFLAAQGRNEEAIAHYLAAIKINPNYDDAYYNLANLYMKQGKIAEAIDNYRQAIKINPGHADAHCNLADVFVQQNKIDQAIEHFREAARITPSSFTALNNLGVQLEKQLKHDEAIDYYRRALQIEPKNSGVHFNLGVALGNKGELKEAAEHFRQAIDLQPNYEEARRALKLALDMNQQKR
jgi:Tfp pilus assembly protein PilF